MLAEFVRNSLEKKTSDSDLLCQKPKNMALLLLDLSEIIRIKYRRAIRQIRRVPDEILPANETLANGKGRKRRNECRRTSRKWRSIINAPFKTLKNFTVYNPPSACIPAAKIFRGERGESRSREFAVFG